MRISCLLAAAALPLAACDGPGTSISIDARSDESNATISTSADGQMAIKAEGFEGKIKLPAIKIDAADFDVNGVKLYPGSTVDTLDIDAEEKLGTRDKGEVAIGFTSPAAPAAVRAWFRDKMAARGFRVETDGTGLKGTTDEGKPFALRLEPAGDHAKGTLRVASE